MRPTPLLNLLRSVKTQTYYPNEILIIDGSYNDETDKVLRENSFRFSTSQRLTAGCPFKPGSRKGILYCHAFVKRYHHK